MHRPRIDRVGLLGLVERFLQMAFGDAACYLLDQEYEYDGSAITNDRFSQKVLSRWTCKSVPLPV